MSRLSPKMQEALRLLGTGMNRHAAALKAGVRPSDVYRYLARHREKPSQPRY